MSEWISVADRLPDDCMPVTAAEFNNGRNFGLAKCFYNYRTERWILDRDCYDCFGDATVLIGFKPTHWMPLPEPPK